MSAPPHRVPPIGQQTALRRLTSRTAIAMIGLVACMTFAVDHAAAGAASQVRARAARALNGNDNCYAHLVKAAGSTLTEEGRCSGPLGGSLRAQMHLGATFGGSFTFYTRYGEIFGRGSAKPHSAGRYESFAGTLTATGGTGRYTHAHGNAGLYGTYDRRTNNLVAQVRGTLNY